MQTYQNRGPFPITTLAVVSVAAIAALAFLSRDPRIDFLAFFGAIPPMAAGTAIAILGIAALFVLQKRFGFRVWQGAGSKRFGIAALLALPFMGAITLLDLTTGFPADINVAPPAAFLFYPAMGFVAQLSLHIVPFALVLTALSWPRLSISFDARIWIAIALVSLIEAAFQIQGTVAAGGLVTVQATILALHVFLFGCVELLLYKRYDFAAMYVFRLTYYAWWHVIWGVLRLQG